MKLATTSHPTAGANPRRESRKVLSLSPLTCSAALLALALLATPVFADTDERSSSRHRTNLRELDTWADGRVVDVQLRVDGEAAPLYWAPGRDDRHYVQAFAGRNYSVVLRNNTGRRVAVLLAVDGLNAVNGEITRLQSHEPMYVLGPWETATIRGWRSSLDEIRRFVFVDERRSYAERTGQSNSDMGWIRVLAFREQQTWFEKQQTDWGKVRSNYRGNGSSPSVPAPSEAPQSRLDDAKGERAPMAQENVPESRARVMTPESKDNLARGEQENGGSFPGTGWGERRTDRVRQVQFTPERVAADRILFRYEYASGLRALGIFPIRHNRRDRLNERDGDLGFAKPPRW